MGGRQPEHSAIQIVAADYQADEIEKRFPGFTLVLLPPDAQSDDDLPAYILTPTSLAGRQ